VGPLIHPCWVCRKCVCNAHNALCHRHGVVQPAVTHGFEDVFEMFALAMRGLVADYSEHPMLVFATWLAKWNQRKQAEILYSIEHGHRLLPGLCQVDVKRECLSAFPTKARLIQFYFNLRTQSEFACQFYALQKVMTERFRFHKMGVCDVTFGSGMNSREIGEWMAVVVRRGAKCFYERDGKCWDATMSAPHAEFRCAMYRCVDPALAEFAESCIDVSCYYRSPGRVRARLFKYKVKGTVKSGHNDTTLGNSLVNAAIAVSVFNRLGIACSIMVAGDDLIVAVYGDFDIALVMSMESEMGIRPEARKFTCPEDTSFISGTFVEVPTGFVFIPKPGKLLAKLWWTVNPPSRRHVVAYRRGVALGLMPTCRIVPVVREFLRPFATRGETIYSSRGYKYHGVYAPDADLAPWFHRRYDTNALEVASLENMIRDAPPDAYIVHPLLERMVAVDLCDIHQRVLTDGVS